MTPTSVPPPSCIGREPELTSLAEVYSGLASGRSKSVLLRGPSGIGKASIMREFRGRVRLEGGVVLEGRCEPGSPYGPFGAILEGAMKFLAEVGVTVEADLSPLGCHRGCHRLWFHHESGGHSEHTPLATPALVPGHMEGDDASEKRHRFYEAVVALIEEVALVKAPVLMVHDLERASQGTVELLRHLLDSELTPRGPSRTGHPSGWMLLGGVTTLAESASPPWIDVAFSSKPVVYIEVGDLSLDGVKEYLQSEGVLQQILETTGGRPELIDRLLAAEPLSPQAMLERQVRTMLPDARPLLEALSILEHEADLDLLAQVAGTQVDSECRKSFWASSLLEHRVVDGRILFRFRKDEQQAQLRAGLGESRERTLHQQAAIAYAGTPGRTLLAARHAIHAKDAERAISLCLAAARILASRYAHREAAQLLDEALGLGEVGEQTIPRSYLCELYRIAGDYPQALVHAEAVSRARPSCAQAALRWGHLLMLSGRLDEAFNRFEDAYRFAVQAVDEPAIVEAEAFLAEVCYQRTTYEEARTWGARAMEEAERLQLDAWQVHSRNTMGKLALAEGDPTRAAILFEENLQQATRSGLEHQRAQALTNLGVTYLRLQRLGEAEKTFARAVEVAAAAHDTREQAIATENLAVLAHLRRDYGTALRRYHNAVDMLKGLGNRTMLARAANNLGELYLSLGNAGRAKALCEYATHVGGTGMPATIVGEGLLLRGRIERVLGNVEGAQAAYEAARRQLADLGSDRVFDIELELARLLLVDGHVEEARSRLGRVPMQESPKRAAEVAILGCDVERAAGRSSMKRAQVALDLAAQFDDDEVRLEALLRAAEAALDENRLTEASDHLRSAFVAESRMGRNLPESARECWVSRRTRGDLLRIRERLSKMGGDGTQHGVDASLAVAGESLSQPPTDGAGELRLKFPDIVGESQPVIRLLRLLDKVAPTDALVLIRGESGTGKELIAEALHAGSARQDKPMVKVNCAALVETLLLSELFGHEKGAFTGADARRKGRFELADGGTIFLDEIGDISAKTQVALLRVLQERQFERVGGTEPIRVDVRIVAATHRDLEAMVAAGTFREDLYYRLRGVVLESPPLRDRSHDIPLLARHILDAIGRERAERPHILSREVEKLLSAHRWPGNIRELENVLRSATLFAESRTLQTVDFNVFSELGPPRGMEVSDTAALQPPKPPAFEAVAYDRVRQGESTLAEMKKAIERACIVRALDETQGNITRAAALLGMKRPRLSQLVKQYELLAPTAK